MASSLSYTHHGRVSVFTVRASEVWSPLQRAGPLMQVVYSSRSSRALGNDHAASPVEGMVSDNSNGKTCHIEHRQGLETSLNGVRCISHHGYMIRSA